MVGIIKKQTLDFKLPAYRIMLYYTAGPDTEQEKQYH